MNNFLFFINMIFKILCLINFVIILNLLNRKENMSNTDIDKKIKEFYKIDVEAIRNLSSLANNLTKNGKLIIPGGLEIKGRLTVDGDTDLKKHANIGGMLRGNYNRLAGRDIFAFSVPGRGYLYFNEDRNLGVHATSGPLKVNNPTIGGNLLVEGTSTFNNKITSKNGGDFSGGTVTFNNKIIGKNGGDFSGGQYFFTDHEKCGRLRVGCAWGVPGIYAEDGKNLRLGSSRGEVQFQENNSRIIGGAGHFNTVNTNTVKTSNINGNVNFNNNVTMHHDLTFKKYNPLIMHGNWRLHWGDRSRYAFS